MFKLNLDPSTIDSPIKLAAYFLTHILLFIFGIVWLIYS